MRAVASCAVPDSPTTSMSPVALEQVAQPATDDLVVVEQEHADRLAGVHGPDCASPQLNIAGSTWIQVCRAPATTRPSAS